MCCCVYLLSILPVINPDLILIRFLLRLVSSDKKRILTLDNVDCMFQIVSNCEVKIKCRFFFYFFESKYGFFFLLLFLYKKLDGGFQFDQNQLQTIGIILLLVNFCLSMSIKMSTLDKVTSNINYHGHIKQENVIIIGL